MPPINLILVGLGPHARRIYYPLLEKYAARNELRLLLVVDLLDQEATIRSFLKVFALQPDQLYFGDPDWRGSETLAPDVLNILNAFAPQADGIIISTEPKAHKAYALWAVDHGLDVLMDKPISAPLDVTNRIGAAQRILEDYEEIDQHLAQSSANFIVQCQRRSHRGYQYVHQYLRDFVQEFQVPISFLDIYHADGMWAMPDELFTRENHPYKYGYGKLMHSGYHFIDLFCWLADVNNAIPHKRPNNADVFVRHFNPADFLHQLEQTDYQRLMKTDRFAPAFAPEREALAESFGEMDVFISAQLLRDQHVTTTASINLQQNSFSRRASPEPPIDVYKGSGRVRHERLTVQVSTLLTIQVHSYQAYGDGTRHADLHGAGHPDHFDVYVFRNSGVVGGSPLEKFSFGEQASQRRLTDPTYLGHNEAAREEIFLDFLQGRTSPSHFSAHRRTNILLSHIYECIALGRNGVSPRSCFPL
ncbi:MAG: hypothetical protein KF716_03520 [Anaerolineae bacterium]|nr:hypothetical protein [Anaerolineae bacterium]